jgi:hypothetical protein
MSSQKEKTNNKYRLSVTVIYLQLPIVLLAVIYHCHMGKASNLYF